MKKKDGEIRVEYDGTMAEGLAEHLKTEKVRIAKIRPLTLLAGKPEDVLNRIYRYLSDEGMRVRRVQFRSAA